jgi:hypothetical protein
MLVSHFQSVWFLVLDSSPDAEIDPSMQLSNSAFSSSSEPDSDGAMATAATAIPSGHAYPADIFRYAEGAGAVLDARYVRAPDNFLEFSH